ncbi:hypothetical protein [Planctomyces sp. SH-PL14]|uniref:hypothetical protein n=1 Tax=Planctomyces sp. SH-PL14 TaxID=1632864 RepID=UPI00078B8542|nr:hypothetical protein [Planctomyces sp. SH-PL14]AMV20401.1 hypothetical protein VT03_21060 [Planctomyces sp. SH-PL14]
MSDCDTTVEPRPRVTEVIVQGGVTVEPVAKVINVDVTRTIEVETYRGPRGRDGINIVPRTHTQTPAAEVWTINHNLGYWPDVTIYRVGGGIMGGTVHNVSLNTLTITFNTAVAGSARLL